MKRCVMVTRKSPLALWQAEFVAEKLQQCNPDWTVEIKGIITEGDEILDQSLSKIGGKGLFVKELEQHLLQGTADLAVHSMKDVPQQLPEGLEIAAILKREDARDALLTRNHEALKDLPKGSVIGSSSLRRQAQLLAHRSDLVIQSLRGNVGTRIKKLQQGDYDAIILAVAGLKRLQISNQISEIFPTTWMVPAVGQGALGVECRSSDETMRVLLAPLQDQLTAACVLAERSMNTRLNGSCHSPIAGYAEIVDQEMWVQGMVAEPEGHRILRASVKGKIEQGIALGEAVAEALLAQGAAEILRGLSHSKN